MHRTISWLLASCAWGICLWWSLLLQNLPAGKFGEHGVCGPWGCGAPVPVLLACHAFWFVLLAPPAAVAAIRMPIQRVRLLGTLCVVLGLSGLVAVGVWEATMWLPQVGDWGRRYVVQRYLFSVVTLVDFPIVQVLLVGAALWLAEGRRLSRTATLTTPTDNESFDHMPQIPASEP